MKQILAAGLILALARPALAAPPTCSDPLLNPPITSSANVSVTVDPKPSKEPPDNLVDPQPAWQPRGGTVAFTLKASQGTNLGAVKVLVCFGWKNADWMASEHLWVTRTATDEVTYNAVVPRLHSAPSGVRRCGFWIVPLADMRVFAYQDDPATRIDVVRSVGITEPWIAALAAVVAVGAGLLMFWIFARERMVPGRGFLLWLISTRNGVASLSQLQIMLWTFVVGAAAVYVMALSGALIEITNGTLVLLGIAGLATLSSKLHNAQEDNKGPTAPSPTVAPPDPVSDIQLVASDEREIRVAWVAPATGGLTGYTVEYAPAPAAGGQPTSWMAVREPIRYPHRTIFGLQPGTGYFVRVSAANAGGRGTGTVAGPFQTQPQANLPQGAPGPVAGLRVAAPPSRFAVELAWASVARSTGYRVQFRPNDTDAAWEDATFGPNNELATSGHQGADRGPGFGNQLRFPRLRQVRCGVRAVVGPDHLPDHAGPVVLRPGRCRGRPRRGRRDAGADAVLHRRDRPVRHDDGDQQLHDPGDPAGLPAADGDQQRALCREQVHPELSAQT